MGETKNLRRDWQRLVFDGQPVYIHPEKPDWFVPEGQADNHLQSALQNASFVDAVCQSADNDNSLSASLLNASRLFSQLQVGIIPPYEGRASLLELRGLKECWFHLTNRCNLACHHCLFGASPAESLNLDVRLLRQGLAEARGLGCTLFYFTGGEPFVYPDFPFILAELLDDPKVHAVVLTNGMLLERFADQLQRLPEDRFHLQISMDGMERGHELLRGSGTFAGLLANLAILKQLELRPTLSVAVSRANLDELPTLVNFAAGNGFGNIHFLWHFVRGKGSMQQFVQPAEILPQLIKAQEAAESAGIIIDNIETIKSQVFSTPGTRYDLSNAGWESLAIGPDGCVYPSPALVAVSELNCGHLAKGLEQIWRHSAVLADVRRATLLDSETCCRDPLKYMIGGGDLDHSYLAGGEFVGHDPYLPLYRDIALWLMVRQARSYTNRAAGSLLLRMGDVRFDCPDGGSGVSLTHCNCVISLTDDRGHKSVRDFYGQAAQQANADIVNPFAPQQAEATFIPLASRQRSYGCGSPVSDASIGNNDVVVDLGSGSGVECFMAAEKVGSGGRVYGIDMTDAMLELARSAQPEVAARLGYANVEFRKGFLEDIPLTDNEADVVISNCVINLSPDKRRTFHEIFRILKPGGRMVISDIVTDVPVPVAIRNNEQFRGECLGGAMQQEDLLAMLRGVGFVGTRLIKRFPYREEGGVPFFSLTFSCLKPNAAQQVDVVYRGPFGAVYTESGVLLLKGKRTTIDITDAKGLDESVFMLDGQGAVTNIQMSNSCCSPATEPAGLPKAAIPTKFPMTSGCCGTDTAMPKQHPDKIVPLALLKPKESPVRHQAGCMACGTELHYLPAEQEATCFYCGGRRWTNALCANDHFICDDCHQQDGLSVIKLLCAETLEADMLTLLRKIRSHPTVPMHGPEHHAMVPGIILATYRNLGGDVSREAILTGIERGSRVPGGVCGFWGNCGAAAGVGIAFSVIFDATPLTPAPRQQAQTVTARVLSRIAEIKGARCCQRETLTALREAALLSVEMLPVPLRADDDFCCTQHERNKECIRRQCPLWCGQAGCQDDKNTAAERP